MRYPKTLIVTVHGSCWYVQCCHKEGRPYVRSGPLARVLYLANGGDPELEADHVCGDKKCVNPAHLQGLTKSENISKSWKGERPNYTHCKRGHTLEGDNVMKNGSRNMCRECHRMRSRIGARKRRAT